VDAVIHLAELSNDPLGHLDPALTLEINHQATVRMAEAAMEAGVKRFVYASSCSVYGASNGEFCDETAAMNPQTEYAEAKVLNEQALSGMASKHFTPVYMRNATACGPSPAMRFDLVLNNLAGLAYTAGRIAMTSDGTPWRPLVHVQDIARALLLGVEAPVELVHNQAFNVGDTRENFRIAEIAEAVGRAFPGCELTFGSLSGDTRTYRVDCGKIERVLGYSCRHDLDGTARELARCYEQMQLTKEMFESAPYTRLKRIQQLRAEGLLDAKLNWTSPQMAAVGE
jgi:nucleoside-diphosphate-sugar epimerase